MRLLERAGAVAFAALAMLSLLLAVATLALGRLEGTAFYLALMVLASASVAFLMRRDARRRRAEEALLPPQARPPRRVPRRPITFPLRETTLTFAFWYLTAALIDRAITGQGSYFTLAVIAPFAAFMLTALTIAGRHMAFRLTAEEDEEAAGDGAGGRKDRY